MTTTLEEELVREGLLPKDGLISIEELARRLGTKKYRLAQNLKARHIPIVDIGSRLLSQRFIRLEDLTGEI